MTTDNSDRLALLADEGDIARLLTRYAWCVDDKRWEDWAACFTEDVAVTMPFAAHTGRAGLADWGRAALAPFEITHHMSTNFEITIDGDRATGRSKFQAVHIGSADRLAEHFTESGVYNWQFRRTPSDGWLIASCALTPSWTAGLDEIGLAGG